jgi:TPR repeat protein
MTIIHKIGIGFGVLVLLAVIFGDKNDNNVNNTEESPLHKSAASGDAKAQLRLARAYAIGDDTPNVSGDAAQAVVPGIHRDEQKAVEWYTKAAEQGEVTAQSALSAFYWFGLGVAKDYQKAIYWEKKAARQGDSKAQESLQTARTIVESDPFHSYTTEERQQMKAALEKEDE